MGVTARTKGEIVDQGGFHVNWAHIMKSKVFWDSQPVELGFSKPPGRKRVAADGTVMKRKKR